jgi:LmbE family N-acetylglucosaminyl deacetylase
VNVLAIGAHPDDIELGCGGALLRHAAAGHRVTMLVMTTGERGPQDAISRVHEQERAAECIGAELLWGGFADGAIPHTRDTVAFLDQVIAQTDADVLYTHAGRDSHQDHVATSLSALSAARKLSRVLCFQSPSTTQFEPTMYIDVESTVTGKVEALSMHYSQVLRCEMVDLEAVEAGCRFWGHHARMRYAEPFEAPRFAWDMDLEAVPRRALRSVDSAAVTAGTGTTGAVTTGTGTTVWTGTDGEQPRPVLVSSARMEAAST